MKEDISEEGSDFLTPCVCHDTHKHKHYLKIIIYVV